MQIERTIVAVISALFKYAGSAVHFLGAALFRLLVSILFFVVLMMCFKHRLNEESGNEYGKAT